MTIETVGGLLVVLIIAWGFVSILLLKVGKDILKIKMLLEALVLYILQTDAGWHDGYNIPMTDVYTMLDKMLSYSKEK